MNLSQACTGMGMLGFATGLDRKNAFSFGLGYSYKSFKEIKEIVGNVF
jgi:hypothetical protein